MKSEKLSFPSGWKRSVPIFAALVSGAAGGALFALMGLPMPWLLGAICGTAMPAMAGIAVRVPSWLRNIILVVLGLMIGSGIHHDSLANISRWPITMVGVTVYVIVVIATIYHFLRRCAGFDPVTAYFAASPGGILMMTTLGGAFGGRERSIALTHAVRVVLVLFTIVFGYHLMFGAGSAAISSVGTVPRLTWLQVGLWAVIGAAGWFAGRLLHMPAAAMLGPFLLIAIAQLLGLVLQPLPVFPLLVAEVVIGSGIGSDFAGVKIRELVHGMVLSFLVTLWMLILSLIFSLALRPITGLPLDALFLAFSPGGLTGISLVALALKIDPAFVTAHNVLRVVLILFASPLVFQTISRRGNHRNERRKEM
jgi:uncharacterized protein